MSEAAVAPSASVEQAPSNEVSDSPVQPSAAKPAEVQKVKLKIDGKEVSVDQAALKKIAEELGTTEEFFVRDFGTSANATRKAQEVAKLRKEVDAQRAEVQQLFNDLKADPARLWDIAKELGHDPEALAEDRVWKKIQYEKMSPEARQAMAERQRADAAERALKEREEADNAKQAQAFAEQAEAEIESDVLKVLELTKRKAEPGLIRRVAEIYESYMLAKKTKPSHDYVAQKLRDYRRQELMDDLSGTDIEELMNNLPKEFISKFQSHLVSKARSKDLPSITPSLAPSKPKAKPERVTIDDFFKNL